MSKYRSMRRGYYYDDEEDDDDDEAVESAPSKENEEESTSAPDEAPLQGREAAKEDGETNDVTKTHVPQGAVEGDQDVGGHDCDQDAVAPEVEEPDEKDSSVVNKTKEEGDTEGKCGAQEENTGVEESGGATDEPQAAANGDAAREQGNGNAKGDACGADETSKELAKDDSSEAGDSDASVPSIVVGTEEVVSPRSKADRESKRMKKRAREKSVSREKSPRDKAAKSKSRQSKRSKAKSAAASGSKAEGDPPQLERMDTPMVTDGAIKRKAETTEQKPTRQWAGREQGVTKTSVPDKPKPRGSWRSSGKKAARRKTVFLGRRDSTGTGVKRDEVTPQELQRLQEAAANVQLRLFAISQQADVLKKRRDEGITGGRLLAHAVLQHGASVQAMDDTSLLAESLLKAAEFVNTLEELNASLDRNLEKKLVDPLKDQIKREVQAERELEKTEDEFEAYALLVRNKKDSRLTILTAVSQFMDVYSSYFKIGQQALEDTRKQILEYRSLISLHDDVLPFHDKGSRFEVPARDIIHQGQLTKKGGQRRNWNKRWFVLRPRCLFYFNNRSDWELKGHIELVNCKVTTSDARTHCFAVETPQRTFYINAESDEERRVWIEQIQSCIIEEPEERTMIQLVEAKMQAHLSSAGYVTPKSVEHFLATDQFGKFWRDFRAKNKGMIRWVHERENISQLIRYLAMDETVCPMMPKPSDHDLADSEHMVQDRNRQLQYASLAASVIMFDGFDIGKLYHIPGLLDEFFSFLSVDPPISFHSSALFAEVLDFLFVQRPLETFEYLRDHPKVVDCIVKHVDNEPLLRVCLCLWRYDHSKAQVQVLNSLGVKAMDAFLERKSSFESEEYHHLSVFLQVLLRRHKILKLRIAPTVLVPHGPRAARRKQNRRSQIKSVVPQFSAMGGGSDALSFLAAMQGESDSAEEGKNSGEEGERRYSPRANTAIIVTTTEVDEAPASKPEDAPPDSSKPFVMKPVFTSSREEELGDIGDGNYEFEEDEDDHAASGSSDATPSGPEEGAEANHSEKVEEDSKSAAGDDGEQNEGDKDEGDQDEGDQSDQGNDSDPKEKRTSTAPKRPPPSVPPQKSGNSLGVSASLLNVQRSSGRLSRTGTSNMLFLTYLKNAGVLRQLVNKALRSEDHRTAVPAIELVITLLKINVSEEVCAGSAQRQSMMSVQVQQRPPHPVITALAGQATTIYGLLRVKSREKKRKKGEHWQNPKVPPLGLLRLAVVKLVCFLIGTGYKFVDTKMLDSKLLVRCVDLMFTYRYHSVLQIVVSTMLFTIFDDVKHGDLAVYLIKKYHLHKKLMAEFNTDGESHERETFQAHLQQVANMLASNRRAKKILKKNEQWSEFVVNTLSVRNREQYVDPSKRPQRDEEKAREDEEKWQKRWDNYNYLISHQ